GISLVLRLPPSVGPLPIPVPTHAPGPTVTTEATARAAAWTATGDMIQARTGHTATLLVDGKVLVAGGASSYGGGDTASAELYDPSGRTWTATGNMLMAHGG